jgi:hypothetical protein
MKKRHRKNLTVNGEKSLAKKNDNNIIISLILFFLGLGFIYFCFINNHIQDDAFITFQYVKNFVTGNGLVFNPNEFVEGYTSPLWLFMLSFFVMFEAEIVQTAQIISVLFGTASITILYFFSLSIFNKITNSKRNSVVIKTFALIAPLMLAFNGAFQYWSISGMETSLFVFLTIAGFYFYYKNENDKNLFISSTFFTLASLTRPEGWLIFGLVFLDFFYKQFEQNKLKKLFNNKKLLIFSLIFLIPNLLLLIFRLMYYGYPFPNTFYAKTGFNLSYIEAGLKYTLDFINTYTFYGILLLLIVLLLIQKTIRNEFVLLFGTIFIYILYVIMIGGDVLPIYRFFLPILPIIFLLVTLFFFVLIHMKCSGKNYIIHTFLPLILLFVITAYNFYAPKAKIDRFAFYEDNLVTKMSGTGIWLNEYQIKKNKKLIVAATTIGALTYYSNTVVIDMLGLTDEKIAHEPNPIPEISQSESGWKERNYDADYILNLRPDFIYFSTGIKPSAFAERALFTKEEFINYYYPYYFEAVEGFTDVIYKRKDTIPADSSFVKFSGNPKFDLVYIDLYVRTINLKFEHDKLDEIINLSKKLIEIGPPNFFEPYRLISTALGFKNQELEMMEMVKKSLDINFYNMNGHIILFSYYFSNGNKEKAKYHFDVLKELDPDYLIASRIADAF